MFTAPAGTKLTREWADAAVPQEIKIGWPGLADHGVTGEELISILIRKLNHTKIPGYPCSGRKEHFSCLS
jgi:hypothetical protein